MEIKTKNLGKVCITCEGDWDINKQYSKLSLVTNSDNKSYISKQDVPINTDIQNIEYWQFVGFSDDFYRLKVASIDTTEIVIKDFDYNNLEKAIINNKTIIISLNSEIGNYNRKEYIIKEIQKTTEGYNLKYDHIDDYAGDRLILNSNVINIIPNGNIYNEGIGFELSSNILNIENYNNSTDETYSKRFLASDGQYHKINFEEDYNPYFIIEDLDIFTEGSGEIDSDFFDSLMNAISNNKTIVFKSAGVNYTQYVANYFNIYNDGDGVQFKICKINTDNSIAISNITFINNSYDIVVENIPVLQESNIYKFIADGDSISITKYNELKAAISNDKIIQLNASLVTNYESNSNNVVLYIESNKIDDAGTTLTKNIWKYTITNTGEVNVVSYTNTFN